MAFFRDPTGNLLALMAERGTYVGQQLGALFRIVAQPVSAAAPRTLDSSVFTVTV